VQVQEFLEESVRRFPQKTALVCQGRRFAYVEIEERCNRFAQALVADGIDRGERVAVYLENSPEAVISVFATLKADGAFVVINPATKTDRLAYILNNCRATVVVTHVKKLGSVQDCWARAPYLRRVYVVGGAGPRAHEAGKECIPLDAILETPELPGSRPARKSIDEDLAALVYTSGSTGGPKGVMLAHRNVVAAATSIATYLENTPDDIVLDVLPLSFGYGLYQVLVAFKVGATVVLERSFTFPHVVLEKIGSERVTGFPIVPTMSALMLQTDLSRYDFSSVRYLSSAGAPLPVEHIRKLRKQFPRARIFSMYGLTECTRVAYLPPDQIDERPTSVGNAMPNVDAWIVDEQGQRVPPGVVGELVVRGSNVMLGYWEAPEETARALRPGPLGDRVLHSGDLFKTDDAGFLYFVGRRDDLIKTRGQRVSPREVEDVLYQLPGVIEAAVFGVPDAVLGKAIKAVVAVRKDTELTEQKVQAHCAKHLEDFMVPQVVEFRDALPKTDTGKVIRRELSTQPGSRP